MIGVSADGPCRNIVHVHASHCAVAITAHAATHQWDCAGLPCMQIRPEFVKRIALRIVSAALAAPDTASTACTTPAADAARALALSSPGQQRRLTLPEQVQQLPQRPCSPGLALLQGRESMQEFSVSAFDHETAAYLIPVSHIGELSHCKYSHRGRNIAQHSTASQHSAENNKSGPY